MYVKKDVKPSFVMQKYDDNEFINKYTLFKKIKMNIFFTFKGGFIRMLEHLQPDKSVQLNPVQTLSTLIRPESFKTIQPLCSTWTSTFLLWDRDHVSS